MKDDEKDEEDDDDEEEEEDSKEEDEKEKLEKISLEQFICLLFPTKNHYPAIISCGVKSNEIYIIL